MSTQPTVLVIDDSEMIHSLIPTRLKGLGVRIISASDGINGLAAVVQHEPDLILLDVNMPGMSGFDVCQSLKNNPETHDIPVIFLTGSDEPLDKVRGFDLGAVDYVTKPFDPAELRARVRAALRTKALMDMLTNQAQLDGLTGLHNRRYFDQRFEQELEACRRYSRSIGLIMLDIDHFKTINDTFGHPKGDEVLKHLADLLVQMCRSSDVACRYGGEEFALIAPEASHEVVFAFAERLLQAVRSCAALQAVTERKITVSMGVTSAAPEDGLLAAAIVQAADKALYSAKAGGRNRIVSSAGATSAATAA